MLLNGRRSKVYCRRDSKPWVQIIIIVVASLARTIVAVYLAKISRVLGIQEFK